MRRAVPLIIGCLLILATVESTFAQQRLFANTGRAFVELDPRLPSLGAVIRRFSLVPRADTVAGLDARAPLNRDAVSFGGGAFIAWASTHGVALFNTSSGAVQEFTFPDFVGSKVIGTDGVARLLVLGTNAAEHLVVVVADARAGSTHLLDLGPRRRGGPIAYAWASDVLFIARPRTMTVFGGFDFFDVEVIDVKTGAVLKTVDTSPAYVEFLSTNAAGTRLFVTDLLTGTAAFDVATGAILASGTSRGLAYGFPIVVDEARNRLVVNLDGVEAFSADSLQSLVKASVPGLPLPQARSPETATLTRELNVSGQSATMFMLQSVLVGYSYYRHTCYQSQIVALDANTGQVRGAADMTGVLGGDACWTDFIRLTEPGVPGSPTAHVSGRTVTLTWPMTKDTLRYELEAGSAPGLANLATLPLTETQLTVDGAPSGVYYLRVRAKNTIGKSAPSQEIRVVVQ